MKKINEFEFEIETDFNCLIISSNFLLPLTPMDFTNLSVKEGRVRFVPPNSFFHLIKFEKEEEQQTIKKTAIGLIENFIKQKLN